MGTFGAEEVFGIAPDEVVRASSELDGHGSALRETGKSLSGGGAPPRDCLPGGLAAEYLEIAADRVGKLAAAEGSSTGSAASELRIFVDAVTGAESGSAERLGGRRR